jgi:hypothetical protein
MQHIKGAAHSDDAVSLLGLSSNLLMFLTYLPHHRNATLSELWKSAFSALD